MFLLSVVSIIVPYYVIMYIENVIEPGTPDQRQSWQHSEKYG